MKPVASHIVEACLDRAQYSCEICGSGVGDRRGEDWSLHHRRPRKSGGTRWPGISLPSNLLILCGSGTTGCHGFVESNRVGAIAGGWLVSQYADPRKEKVFIVRERWVFLTDTGTYEAA
jgi:hypothetical protein